MPILPLRGGLMAGEEKQILKYQKQYLHLINKITELKLSEQNPSSELLTEPQKIGRLGEIPEAFFITF